jgi:Zn-dependent protease
VTVNGGGSRRAGGWHPPGNPRTWIIGIVAFAAVVIALETRRINRFEIIYFCVLVPSIIIHEISHGAVALAFGDDTAKRLGRLNLNPVRHVDPVGTLLVPAVLSLSGLGAYGWAKPVPVNPSRLRSPRNHTVLVSLVGPTTNFVLAALLGVVYVFVVPPDIRSQLGQLAAQGLVAYPPSFFGQVVFIAALANIVLGVFNLIPCPPLDGAAVLERFIPARSLGEYYRLQPALMFLPFILILLFRNQWSELINQVMAWFAQIVA